GIDAAITGGVKKEEGKPAGLLSSRGQLTIDQRTNSLIVRDIGPYVDRIREFVTKLDRPIPAVQIEAPIVQITKGDARPPCVVWRGAFTPKAGANSPVVNVAGGTGPNVAKGGDSPTTIPPSGAANFPARPFDLPFTQGNLFGLAIGWIASNLALDIQLQALEG